MTEFGKRQAILHRCYIDGAHKLYSASSSESHMQPGQRKPLLVEGHSAWVLTVAGSRVLQVRRCHQASKGGEARQTIPKTGILMPDVTVPAGSWIGRMALDGAGTKPIQPEAQVERWIGKAKSWTEHVGRGSIVEIQREN